MCYKIYVCFIKSIRKDLSVQTHLREQILRERAKDK